MVDALQKGDVSDHPPGDELRLDKLALLRSKKKATDTRVKIIVGAVVLKAALATRDAAAKLAGLLRERVTRDLDVKDLQQVLASLDKKAARKS